MNRTNVYIDGFNLYFGMRDTCTNTKWLNVEKLAQNLLRDNQQLGQVKYFTARVANNPPKEHRQRTYLDALETTNTQIIYGKYHSKPKKCNSCGMQWNQNEEKMTDVNIAVNLLVDAMLDTYDTALLISGDSDLVPPIKAIQQQFPNKRIVVAFPPGRSSFDLKNTANAHFHIWCSKLSKSQFPNQIQRTDGFTIQKPLQW